MGNCQSTSHGYSMEKTKLSRNVQTMLDIAKQDTLYSADEIERLWLEFSNLSEGRNNEKLTFVYLSKHKFGAKLIYLILEQQGMDHRKLGLNHDDEDLTPEEEEALEEAAKERADPVALFPRLVKILSILRKGSIADQLQWYFHLFDVNDDGEMDPDEMASMVKVMLENNPTMSEIAASDAAIQRMVAEIFEEADDDGDGVLSLNEFLSHASFITKKILLRNTSFGQRTRRIMRSMQNSNDTAYTKYTTPSEG
jgi:Ca2+-binding EF-hand superfamily protein